MISAGLLAPLLWKMGVTALVVAGGAWLAERLGPFWGAVAISIPMSAGPAFVFLALANGDEFLARSALAGLVSQVGAASFLAAYVHLSPRLNPLLTAVSAIAVWVVAILLVRLHQWTFLEAAVLVSLAFAIAIKLTPKVIGLGNAQPVQGRWYDLPLRGLIVGTLVGTVVTISDRIGPTATGMAAMFPIVSLSVGVILHMRLGGRAVSGVMATSLRGVIGVGLALVVVTLLAEKIGGLWSLLIGLLVSVVWTLGLVLWARYRHTNPSLAPT